MLVILPFAFASATQARGHASVNPVTKVVQLLGSLEAKLIKDGEAEEKAYESYAAWCKDGSKDLGYEIKTAKGDIEELTATIAKAGADADAASSKIEELGADISQNAAELKEATGIRKQEEKEFKVEESELEDAIDTLDRAINVLEKKLRGSALVQAPVNTRDVSQLMKTLDLVVDAASMSLHDKQRLTSFAQSSLDQSDDAEELGAPAAEAYKSKSGGIIEVLEDMRGKASTQLKKLQTEERSSRHNFELLKQSLNDQMAADSKEMDQSKSTKAEAESTKAVAAGDLASTQDSLALAEKTLANMGTGCKAAEEDHAASVKSRAEELKALAVAKKALSENTGGAQDVVYSAASFVQTDDTQRLSTRADLINVEVVNLLRELAQKDQSPALNQLASRVSATVRFGSRSGADPFTKVKKMISEMIETLEKQGAQEATHKAWCDEQMGDTKQKTLELNHDIEVQTAKIDKAKSKSIKLKDEVKGLQSALADLSKSQAELDSVRRAENKVYLATKSDLEQGLKGVRMAIKVLQDYYGGAALVQQPKLEPGHSKSSGAGSSILGFLQVVEQDFGKSLAAAEAEEDTAAVEYEKVSMGNRLNKAQWTKDVEYKEKEYKGLDKAVAEISSDRDSSQSELDAVLEYTKTVRGACEAKPETYEDRKGRRTDEIAGLKQALEILEGQAVFLQKGRRSKFLQ